MENIFRLFLIYYLIILILLMIGGFYLGYRFYSFLEEKYPDIYDSLGKPTIFFNYSVQKSLLVKQFFKKREYLSLNDKRLTKLCVIMANYSKIIGVLVIAYMLIGAGFLFLNYF